MTHLHISVPAITRDTLARTHELKKGLFKDAYAYLAGPFLDNWCLQQIPLDCMENQMLVEGTSVINGPKRNKWTQA